MTDLSRPERSCARSEAQRIRDRVHADGGCAYCLHRDRMFEGLGRRFVCGLHTPLAFPDCTSSTTGFDFDEAAFRGAQPDSPEHITTLVEGLLSIDSQPLSRIVDALEDALRTEKVPERHWIGRQRELALAALQELRRRGRADSHRCRADGAHWRKIDG